LASYSILDLQELVAAATEQVLVLQRASELESSQYRAMDPWLLSAAAVAKTIDHTLLKPDATADQIRQICDEARTYRFASVCVHPTWVKFCGELLDRTDVKVCTVVGFPLGATLPAVKAFETEQVVHLGAQEVDMVLNVGRLKSGDYAIVYEDMAVVVEAAHRLGALVKVIIETFLLSEQEKIAACALAKAAGVDFVKTSTGFSGGGATAADVRLMRRVVGSDIGVKAAGGVRTADDTRQVIAAGATRIGASAGVQIVQDFDRKVEMEPSTEPAPRAGEGY
jgi:deoxyribose-phosphate aldolase